MIPALGRIHVRSLGPFRARYVPVDSSPTSFSGAYGDEPDTLKPLGRCHAWRGDERAQFRHAGAPVSGI